MWWSISVFSFSGFTCSNCNKFLIKIVSNETRNPTMERIDSRNNILNGKFSFGIRRHPKKNSEFYFKFSITVQSKYVPVDLSLKVVWPCFQSARILQFLQLTIRHMPFGPVLENQKHIWEYLVLVNNTYLFI